MKRTLWRLTAATTGALAALTMSVGPAGASSSGDHRPQRNPVQLADQAARTEQNAESSAKSVQFLPVNANVPVQILSLGSNGGKTTQSNDSTAKSFASNQAWTDQSLDQHQKVKGDAPKGYHHPKGHGPKGYDHPKGDDHKGKDCDKGHGTKGHGPKGHKAPASAFQGASQKARTDQNAESSAKSVQLLPVNANVPVQILSLGSNGGKTTQSNDSTAKSEASNQAWTDQSLDQHQKVEGDESKGHGSYGHDGWKPDDGQKGYDSKGDHGSAAFQGASQKASTDQNAVSDATSKQIAPININAPVQILSLGSNGGDTRQSNDSTAVSGAFNEAGTDQSATQHQQAGPGPAFQGASQEASTDQNAESSATSKQILPVNANVPVQILSLGHNGGDTTQSNGSTAVSGATNEAGTSQSLGQSQGVLGLIG